MSAAYPPMENGIVAIDTEYVRPGMDASHLIVDSGRAAFIDTGTSFSVPKLLQALAARDLDVDAVDYVILTHVHLDHAGGAGRLIRALPRARVLVHPRGAAHMVDPTTLISAAKAVYGDARFLEAYGEIVAIPRERIEAVAEGRRIELGRRVLEFIHTPGHALHHVCIVDRAAGAVFTGDTFGVSYRGFDTAAGAFIFPTTTPTQFDPQQLHASIERILESHPSHAYLTHYSRVEQLELLSDDLHADIDAFVAIAVAATGELDRTQRIQARMFEHLSVRLDRHGYQGDDAQRHALLDGDIALNAAGLHAWLARRRA